MTKTNTDMNVSVDDILQLERVNSKRNHRNERDNLVDKVLQPERVGSIPEPKNKDNLLLVDDIVPSRHEEWANVRSMEQRSSNPRSLGAIRNRRENMERPRSEPILPLIPFVCLEPDKLIFNAQSHENLTQILKISNPYEDTIKFRVTSNANTWYEVIEPEGYISPKHVIDLIIRVHSHALASCKTVQEHKFRIQIYHRKDEKRVLARREIESVIYFGKLPPHLDPNDSMSDGLTDAFQSCPPGRDRNSGSSKSRHYPISSSGGSSTTTTTSYSPGDNPIVICFLLAALTLLVIFVFPFDNEDCRCGEDTAKLTSSPSQISFISNFLHISFNLKYKLSAAFVLGLVSSYITSFLINYFRL